MARATLIGFSAVAMWALLALFTDASGSVPPFQLSAMAFTIGALVGFAFRFASHSTAETAKVPLAAWFVGIAGLFGYHFFYFTALRNAPAAEASLIAYLWPLLIVIGSAAMPKEKLGLHHVGGAIMGLAGTLLILTGGGTSGFDGEFVFGYAMAAICAIVWSSYSLFSRRFASVPTKIVAWFCLVSALLSFACHLILERTVWPETQLQWLAVLGLGLMPVGTAFYAWDHGVKHGNIQVLGASSYAAPLLSTIILIAAGRTALTVTIAAACLLITGGALLAARDMLFGRRSKLLPAES